MLCGGRPALGGPLPTLMARAGPCPGGGPDIATLLLFLCWGGEWGEVDACVAGREVRGALRVKGWVGDGKLSLAVGGCERSPVK